MHLVVAAVDDRNVAVARKGFSAVAAYRQSLKLEVADLVAELIADIVHEDFIADANDRGRQHAVLVERARHADVEHRLGGYVQDLGRVGRINFHIAGAPDRVLVANPV